jgi:hypothetical protein
MDPVFDAQFRIIKETFANNHTQLGVAYSARGEVEYVYEVDRLLAVDSDDNISRVLALLPGARPLGDPGGPAGDLVLLSIEALADGELTVPEALDLYESRLGDDERAIQKTGRTPTGPNHLVHIARLCSPVEPEVPSAQPVVPWPGPCPPPQEEGHEVLVGVVDTGLLANRTPGQHPWLDGVTGDPDPLEKLWANGQRRIEAFAGHGTFVAGVARCMAPQADVVVTDHFSKSGAELESVMVDKLAELVQRSPSPDIINLSAGTYTRNNWNPLGFDSFHRRHPQVTLVAAAGNDSTDRQFYPAAFPWAIAVGSLGPDQQHRAWFSNYGDWVDVYALGEGLINAYATGEYIYREPPKRPARQNFTGMARWDGTSFSAPLVAGLIAARMSRTGESSQDAANAVLAAAQAQAISGIGPVLYPLCDQP